MIALKHFTIYAETGHKNQKDFVFGVAIIKEWKTMAFLIYVTVCLTCLTLTIHHLPLQSIPAKRIAYLYNDVSSGGGSVVESH